ncbi:MULTISPECIES: S1 RNA-binding domain-containing protein [Streptomyces]|uniref:S1 RNA-binding domain-containing protein n=1 Tax=Streptomyces TaxID=1883 RepID=UPI000BE34A0F|nr:S1 RNA-binding domain-containing protein [Streptomyces sp. 1222.2]
MGAADLVDADVHGPGASDQRNEKPRQQTTLDNLKAGRTYSLIASLGHQTPAGGSAALGGYVNSVVRGPVTKLVPFGIFVGLDAGTAGLVHCSE